MTLVRIERRPEASFFLNSRVALVLAEPDEKWRAILRARGKVEAPGGLFALFGEAAE